MFEDEGSTIPKRKHLSIYRTQAILAMPFFSEVMPPVLWSLGDIVDCRQALSFFTMADIHAPVSLSYPGSLRAT